jgi:hypothetical protein
MIEKFKKEIQSPELEPLSTFQSERRCWVEFLMPLVTLLMAMVQSKLAEERESKSKLPELFLESQSTSLCRLD